MNIRAVHSMCIKKLPLPGLVALREITALKFIHFEVFNLRRSELENCRSARGPEQPL